MDSIEIVKKRLKDLKSLSENLKASSHFEQSNDENLNLVKLIMNLTKDVANTKIQNQLPQNQDQIEQNQANKIPKKGSQKLHEFLKQVKQKKINEKSRSQRYKQRQKQLVEQIQSCKQQLQKLKSQNDQLQEKVQNYQQKNKKLQRLIQGMKKSQIDQQDSSKQHKHLSYFKLKQPINLFLTKIKILQKDYSKIEYKQMQLELGLNELQIKNVGSDKQENQKNNILRLDLTDLNNVIYINDSLILFVFGEDEDRRSLFLKFNDYEHMHKWDIAIFTNFTVVKSLGRQKMFTNIDALNQQKQKEKIQQKIIEKQKHKKQIDEMQVYILSKIKKVSERELINQQTMPTLRQYFRQQKMLEQSQNQLKRLGFGTLSSFKNLVQLKEKPGQQIKKLQDQNQKQRKRQIQQQQKKQEARKAAQRQEEIQFQRKRQQSIQNKQKQKKSREQLQAKKVNELNTAKNILKSGMYMTKYAEGAFNPHYKRVYLSSDENNLCWKDKQSEQEKSVLIKDIVSVHFAEIGPGISKHVSKKDLGNLKCYVVIKLNSDKRKQLQFGMNVPELMEDFAYNLTIFLDSLKQKEKIILF